MSAKKISHAELLSLLYYDPPSGVFIWTKTRSGKTKKGRRAGGLTSRERFSPLYRSIKIGGRRYREHVLAFFYMTGEWPIGRYREPHANGNLADNRWGNIKTEMLRAQEEEKAWLTSP